MNNEKSGFWSENTFTFTYKEVDRRTIEEIVKYLKDRLEEIKCPLFVIGASRDMVLGEETSREIIEKLN
jgi:pimeloyl-ACP methyl ester carboxylesterase